MTSYENYFSELAQTEKLLKSHGFDRWPTEEEIVRYLFDLNDRLDAICLFAGIETIKDVRGRWLVQGARQAVIR